VGEHHSAGWELIASPEVFIAAAATHAHTSCSASGVTSLPYHHPLPGGRSASCSSNHMNARPLRCSAVDRRALVSDAYMLGIEPVTQRPADGRGARAIMLLLRCGGRSR